MALQAKFEQGMALHQQGKLADAESIYREVLQRQPNHFDALHLLGVIALQTGHTERAVELIGKAIGLKPDYAEAYYNRGIALQELKRPAEALANYDRAIALKPDYPEANNNRGLSLQELNQLDAAVASYDKAIALKADYAEAYCNRGNAFEGLNQLDAAVASYDKAIALKADYAEAYVNRGVALKELNQLDAAIASYDKAIALKADFAEGYWNKSLALLLFGHFDRGWEFFEFGWGIRNGRGDKCNFVKPIWLGKESIVGKTILLHSEQGYGDTIQFCRYVELVADLGARVILEIHKPLMSLLANLDGVAQLIENGSDLPDFDYQCPLLSLPLAFKTTLSSIPANIPYLKADAEKSLFWKEKLGEKNKPRVGLAWSGGFRPDQPESWSVNRRRNIPLMKFAALKNPDIDFYSLQKGQPAESELAELMRDNWDGPRIIDYTNLLNDFSDTAALIDNLDLVISVDTSTVHLAGALGKPVWILNRFDTDWRWLLDRTDSPWYPNAKLYRQEKAGEWDAVIQRLKSDLTGLFASQGTS